MNTAVLRFTFDAKVPLADAEASLLLAAVAAEGLFGETAVRIDFSYFADVPRRALLVDASSAVGTAVARIFTRLITREFSSVAFQVRRVAAPEPAGRDADRAACAA